LDWLKGVLKFSAELKIITKLSNVSIEDARDKWLPKNFQQAGMGFQYTQVFEEKIGFQNNLSILDLLFNTGPEAKNLLIKSCSYK
jgi:hypothetical protein